VLPGGRPLSDAASRAQLAAVWGDVELPATPGREADEILRAAAAGEIALVVGGVDPVDFADPQLAIEALENAPFVVSLEQRESAVTDRADVVLPVAPAVEKCGSYLDWEGRVRPFDATLEQTGALPDLRVLDWVAEAMDVDLGMATARAAQAEIQQLGGWDGARADDPAQAAASAPALSAGQAVLATWRLLLDDGRLQDNEPYLAGTRKPAVARLSETTAKEIGAADGSDVTVRTDRGAVTLPLAVTADMPDRVVWLPLHSPGSHVHEALGVTAGAVVTLENGGAAR
jgi:NADH-quinone oxidoreductase subunit G